MTMAVPLLILMVPLWVITAHRTWDGHWIGLLAGGLALLAMQVNNLWARSFMFYAALWLLGSLVGYVTLPADAPALERLLAIQVHKGAGMLVVACLVAVGVMVAAVKTKRHWLANAVLALAGLQVALTILQALGVDLVYLALLQVSPAYVKANNWRCGSGGTLSNPNVISALVALAVPFGWHHLRRRPFWFLGVVALALAFCAWQATGTAILAIVAGLVALAILERAPHPLWLGVVFLGAGGSIWFLCFDGGINELLGNLRPGGAGARMVTWQATLAAWWDGSPWLGRGPGSWALWWPAIRPPAAWWDWEQAHNEFLQLLFEVGAPGLALVLGWLADLARRAWACRVCPEAAVLGAVLATAAVLCLGSFTMHLAALAAIPLAAAARLDAYSRRYGAR